jgi:hypothetical protein
VIPLKSEHRATALVAVILLLLVFASFPGVVLGTRTFVFRDFGLFSYPVAWFQRQSFWRGELPLWNPYSFCGIPFLAQWNTMCLYPPALFYLLLPLAWSLPVFCLLHLVWGGLGMFHLARRWTRHSLAGALAGIIFGFSGLSLNLLMWPSHVATFSWVPWVLWLVPKGWRLGGRNLAWGIAAAAMQMLAGGPETILVTWGLLALLFLGELLQRLLSRSNPMECATGAAQPARRRLPLIMASRFCGTGLLVGLICSAQLLPFLQLLFQSQRDSSYSASTHDWCLPLTGWANLLVPLFGLMPTPQGVWMQPGQYWTSSYYVGIGTVLLGILAVFRVKDWRVYGLAGVSYISLALAAGDGNVLFCILRWCCPALGWVRYPVKFVLVLAVTAPLLAAFGLASLRRSAAPARGWVLATVLVLLIATLVIGWAGRSGAPDLWPAVWHNALARAAFLLGIAALLSGRILGREIPAPVLQWTRGAGRTGRNGLAGMLLLALFWLDLRTHVPNQNPTAPATIYSDSGATALACLPPLSASARLAVSPKTREAVEHSFLSDTTANFARNRALELPDCNLLDGVRQVDGFFSLVPRNSFRLAQSLASNSTNDLAPLLDFLGVTSITGINQGGPAVIRPRTLPLVTAGQQPLFVEDSAVLVDVCSTNPDLSGTVYLPKEAAPHVHCGRQPRAHILGTQTGNLKLSFETESPTSTLAVIAQTYQPSWQAYVDGKSTALWRANYSFQALQVPAGAHQVELRYDDRAFRAGVMLSLLGMLLWTLLLPQRRFVKSVERSPNTAALAQA